jgi:transposase, IS30 family
MKTHIKFSSGERELLANYLAAGISKPECSRLLNRPLATIKAEVRRNGSWVIDRDGRRVFVYIAITAQAKADKRKLNSAYNKHPLKNASVFALVIKSLRRGWSPEQIAGHLKDLYPDDTNWHICHETIYAFIYDKDNRDKKLWEYLRRGQKKRKKKQGRKVHKSHIPDRISISQRPKAVNNRTEFGHWEGDSIEGRRGQSRHGIHTEVERLSRFIKASKVKNLTSKQALYAQRRIFGSEPDCAVKSTTLDNGKETHEHYRLRSEFNMSTYHAHPYSSYERGTNEHGNWHIRYYFPKGTDFAKVTRTELQAAIDEINHRPRKILGFKSAYEVYYQLLEKEQRGYDSK